MASVPAGVKLDLATRKDLLLAESALYRAKVRYEIVAMRVKRRPAALLKFPLLGLLLLIAGRRQTTSWVAGAGRFVAIARAIASMFALLRAKLSRR